MSNVVWSLQSRRVVVCALLAITLPAVATLANAALTNTGAEAPSRQALLSGTVALPTAERSDPAAAVVEVRPVETRFAVAARKLGHSPPPPPLHRVPVQDDGRYRVRVAAPAVYELRVVAPDAVPMRLSPLPVTADRELPPLALAPRAVSPVTVLDREGQPVAGAFVTAVSADQEPWSRRAGHGWQVAPRHGRTDGAGRVELPRAPAELLDVRVLPHPGELTTTGGNGLEEVRFVLSSRPRTVTTLEVRNPDGGPAPGVVVSTGDLALPLGTTDGAGRLRLRGVPAPGIRFHLHAADGRTAVGLRAARPRGGGAAEGGGQGGPLVLELPPVFTLEGTAVDPAGEPLADVLVWHNRDPGRAVHTAADGRFRISPAPTRRRSFFQLEAAGRLHEAREVPPRQDMRMAPIALRPAAAVRGRVRLADGSPAAGTAVEAVSRSSGTPHFSADGAAGRAWTDDAGRFRLAGLAAGIAHDLTAFRPGYRTAGREVLPEAGGGEMVELTLHRQRAVFGRVLDPEDRPLEGVTVEIEPTDPRIVVRREEGGRQRRATTDGEGWFGFANPPAALLDLTARGDGWAPLTVPGVEVPDGGEGPTDLGTLVLEPGVEIRGRVVGVEGEPVAGVMVTASAGRRGRRGGAETMETGDDGRFRFHSLPAGALRTLAFAAEGYLPHHVEQVRAPTDPPLRVELDPVARLRGRVVDGEGDPVAGAQVDAWHLGTAPGVAQAPRRRSGRRGTATTGDDGRYEIGGLGSGRFAVEAWTDDRRPSGEREVVVEPGGTAVLEDLVLLAGESLAGRVTTDDDVPVEGMRVLAGRQMAVTDGDGAYRVSGLAPGALTVILRHPRYPRQLREVEIEPGENRLDVRVQAGHPVAGRVIDGDGTALGGVRLRLEPEYPTGPQGDTVLSGDDGAFRFPAVVDGRYQVRADKRGFQSAAGARAEPVVVAGEAVRGVEVMMVPSTVLTGDVLGLPGGDLLRVRVEASDGGHRRTGIVDHRGRYRVEELGPGDWRVRASLPGGRREARAVVTVAAGQRRVERDLEFPTGATLAGEVLYDGVPVGGAHVSLVHRAGAGSRETRTAHDGRFLLEGLEPGPYRLTVSHPAESLVHNQELELAGDRTVRVDVRTAEIGGRVVSAADGGPVADAVVTLGQVDGDGRREISRHTVGTGPDGGFRFLRLSEGRYRLTARRDGFATEERFLDVVGSADVEGIEVALTPSAGLRLRVRCADGTAPSHVTVSFLDPASGRSVLMESRAADATGTVPFPTAPPGEWRLLVEGPAGGLVPLDATVPGTAPPEDAAPLRLPAVGALTVRVPPLLDDGTFARLTLTGADGHPWRRIDPDSGTAVAGAAVESGLATVTGVPAGVWTVRVEAVDGRVFAGVAQVPADGRVEVVAR